ncbi:serine hydrolase domain-containing protein [Pontibacter silvestris]|uniref:Serine hydrolase domain-containing protein n=1 Tax=Pontibacter silvestris TaxID=2305183 RepID=A0ABW4WZ57_9BACT|nr:serine hydrolase domain-containing protein [Pontibacter silvestris]MCC9135469.1 beta-lactamase family protein [Pontibacter silvestris]
MLYKHTLTLLLCLCFSFITLAQKTTSASTTLAEANPEKAGMSSKRLQNIDQTLQEYVNKGYVPGAVGLIARNGKIVYYKAIGYDDAEAKDKLQRDDIFRIASQTKAITSVGIMMLYEEGKLQLEDPISKYIPSFKNPQVLDKFNPKDTTYTTKPAKREITIRDLLTHTSGIGYATIGNREIVAIYAKSNIPSGIGTPMGSLGKAITALGKQPLVHQPGERFTYGLNTDVLGYLIEVISGQPLDQYFRNRIFAPLDMNDTWFYLPAEKQDRLVKLYTEGPNKQMVPMPAIGKMTPAYPKAKGTYFSGGAGLSSTIYDYAVFLQMLLNGGEYNGQRILKPATVRLMTSNQIGEVNQGDNKFGLGFSVTTKAGAAKSPVSVGTFGWGGIFGTTYWVDPKEGIVALLYTQKYPNSHGDLEDKFRELVYQAITDSESKE